MLELGRTIVRQLKLARRGEVLDHWLAHHLAETILEVDAATGEVKSSAQDKAVELVLKLWSRRHDLPAAADPLGGYRRAVQVLDRLSPEANPWSRYRRGGSLEDLLSEVFRALSSIVIAGVLLTGRAASRQLSPEEAKMLTEPERELSDDLDRWLDLLTAGKASTSAEDVEVPAFSQAQLKAVVLGHIKAVRDDFLRIEEMLERTIPDDAEDDVEED